MPKNNINITPEMQMTLAKVKIICVKNEEEARTYQKQLEAALQMLGHLIDFTPDDEFQRITEFKK